MQNQNNEKLKWKYTGGLERETFYKSLNLYIEASLEGNDIDGYEAYFKSGRYRVLWGDPSTPKKSLYATDATSVNVFKVPLGKLKDPYDDFDNFLKTKAKSLIDKAYGIQPKEKDSEPEMG